MKEGSQKVKNAYGLEKLEDRTKITKWSTWALVQNNLFWTELPGL